jgi:hypothetical protein
MRYLNAELHNVVDLVEAEDGGYRLLRLPRALADSLNPNAKRSVYYSCGCEIRFNLHSEEAVIYLRRDECGKDIMPHGIAEVWQGDYQGRYQLSPQAVGQEVTAIRVRKLGTQELKPLAGQRKDLFDPELFRVFVPYDWGTSIHGIEGKISPPRKDQVPQNTLLCYGSSITHGGGASVPTGSYAFRLAARLGMDLRNLGLAGAAWMDEEMADYICEQEWSILTLELGINVLHWSLEEFEARCRSFVSKIALRHKDRPIYCISPFLCGEDFKRPDHLQGMRGIIKRLVEELSMEKLHYIDGSSCLTDLSGLSSDGLHPANKGMEEIADQLYQCISSGSH